MKSFSEQFNLIYFPLFNLKKICVKYFPFIFWLINLLNWVFRTLLLFLWNKYFFLTVFSLNFSLWFNNTFSLLFRFSFFYKILLKILYMFIMFTVHLPFIQYGFLLPLAKKTIRQHHRQRVISTDHNQETTEKKHTHTSLLLTSSFKNNKTHGFLNEMFLLIYFFPSFRIFFFLNLSQFCFFFFSLSCRLS